MAFYGMNQLLYDLNPQLFERLVHQDPSLYEEYMLSDDEQEALQEAVQTHSVQKLRDYGALPLLLHRLDPYCDLYQTETEMNTEVN